MTGSAGSCFEHLLTVHSVYIYEIVQLGLLFGDAAKPFRAAVTTRWGVDPYGTGGTSPQIFMKGRTSMVMSSNILEMMLFRMSTRVTAAVVCCILMQILCVVSQKKLRPWTPLGDFRLPDPQSSFMSPNNPVRSTPLVTRILILFRNYNRSKITTWQ